MLDYLKSTKAVLDTGKINNNIQKLLISNPDMKNMIWSNTLFMGDNSLYTVRERIYCILNNITSSPKCNNCGNRVKFGNGSYPPYCSTQCANSCKTKLTKTKQTNFDRYGCHPNQTTEKKEKTKQTNLERYGVEWTGQSSQKIEKTKQTNLERYGVNHFTNREKAKRTNLEKYGVEHPLQNNDILEKMKQTNIERYGKEYPTMGDEIQEKIRQTNMERYGVEYAFQNSDILEKTRESLMLSYGVKFSGQSDIIRNKTKSTILEKYGVDNAFKNIELQNKQKQTMMERYGVEYPLQNLDILEKIKQTNLERYGVEYPLQNLDILEKIKQSNLERYGVEYPNQSHMIGILPLMNDVDWLVDQYINQNKTATQIANELGCVSYETVLKYLRRLEIEIRKTQQSYISKLWMENIMEIEGIGIEYEFPIPGTRYKADGYCLETNTIYEFHGDYWHGNPQIYAPDVVNEVSGKTMGELYQKTIDREELIKSLGYNLVVMWENDFNS